MFAFALGVSAVLPVFCWGFFSPKRVLGKQHACTADLSRNNLCSAVLPCLLSIFCGLKANSFLARRGYCVFTTNVFFPKLLGLCWVGIVFVLES